MKTPHALVAIVALSALACGKPGGGPLYGVRLGDAMSTARDHLVTSGDGRWESEAGAVPALTWTASSPSAPLRRARLEFHKGALVAARFVVSPDAPEAKGPPVVLTSVQAIARDPAPDGARSVTVLSLDCPEHAEEVKALVQRAKLQPLLEVGARVPARNFRESQRVTAGAKALVICEKGLYTRGRHIESEEVAPPRRPLLAMQIFPRWTVKIPPMIAAAAALGGPAVIGGIWYYFSPKHTDVGYQPKQPVPYSHKLHAGDLGMDCRYCHTGVEKSAVASVPPTATCMNCHAHVKKESAALAPIRQSAADGSPVEWVRIHKVPDFAFFDHSAHIAAKVGCSSCHGRIDQMVKVHQQEPLSMAWCLECHRNPEPHLRPKNVAVTDMDWQQRPTEVAANDPNTRHDVNPPQNCTGCHR